MQNTSNNLVTLLKWHGFSIMAHLMGGLFLFKDEMNRMPDGLGIAGAKAPD